MLDGLRRLREVENLSPHGIRLPWRSEPIRTRIVADTPIAPACFSIPVALAAFVSSIGKGLGLSQVFGFTQPSGGSAAIVPGRERGTTVRLCLPAAPPRPVPVADKAEAPGFGLVPGLAAG